MTWAVYRIDDARTGVELDALLSPDMAVISRHDDIRDARRALVEYRAAREREAAEEAGQGDLFE